MFVASTDLASTLSFLLLGLLVLALIVSIVVARARKRGSKTIALDIALTLSGWWLGLSALAVVFVIVKAAVGEGLELPNAALSTAWPEGSPCAAPTATADADLAGASFSDIAATSGATDGAVLSCGTATATALSVEHVSAGIRVLWALAQVTQLALWAMPAAMIAINCFHTLRGRAFGRTVKRSLIGGAIAVAALGILAEVLMGVTSTLALRETIPPMSEWYPPTFALSIPLWPILVAVGLVALAAVFEHGMRLEQANARLAEQNAKLEKDTEGLV